MYDGANYTLGNPSTNQPDWNTHKFNARLDTRLFDGRLWLVTGARYERTADRGAGPLNDVTAQYQKHPNGTLVDGNPTLPGIQRVPLSGDPLVLRKLRYQERAARSDRTYDGYYPSLNSSLYLSDQLIFRAAYAKTLGRPNDGGHAGAARAVRARERSLAAHLRPQHPEQRR